MEQVNTVQSVKVKGRQPTHLTELPHLMNRETQSSNAGEADQGNNKSSIVPPRLMSIIMQIIKISPIIMLIIIIQDLSE